MKRPEIKECFRRVEFTAGNLNSLLRQVYEKGCEAGKQSATPPADDPGVFSSMWNDLFGGGK